MNSIQAISIVMKNSSLVKLIVAITAFVLAGCATRPVNLPIEHFDPATKYSFQRSSEDPGGRQNFVILAFSGGGTRAAAFSYGALETLRDMELTTRSGRKLRALDEVDLDQRVPDQRARIRWSCSVVGSRRPSRSRGNSSDRQGRSVP